MLSCFRYGTSNEAFQMSPEMDPELNPPQATPMTPMKTFQRFSSQSEPETELASPDDGELFKNLQYT